MKKFPHCIQLCLLALFFLAIPVKGTHAQTELENCTITWTSQSKNAAGSMPCGGGSIGLNVWVEKGDLFFYMARSGNFDENNALLKSGRVRVRLSPNPLAGKTFQQQLNLTDGAVTITGKNGALETRIKIWVDVFQPVIHVTIQNTQSVVAEAIYESWRNKDRLHTGKANNANSYKWAPQGDVFTIKDSIAFTGDGVTFFHRNKAATVFDVTVKQQGLNAVKDSLYNPLRNLTFGGRLEGTAMQPAGTFAGTYLDTDYTGWRLKSKGAGRSQQITIYLHTSQAESLQQWQEELNNTVLVSEKNRKNESENQNWWKEFWDRSFIYLNSGATEKDTVWQAGRNYQLFRYMLACNAFGTYPTKFNGGLFTFDPGLTDSASGFTPDFRNWGGGTHTAQNQRLVYFPMIKNGDFDLLRPQLNFYLRLLKNAETRSNVYWNHAGACFTEQLENFGLPNPAEYGWNRPPAFDKGVEYNAWLEYEWDTVLEFCLMMLEEERYTGNNVSDHIPFIESCLRFFDEHYQYLAKQRGRKALDGNGHLLLYPGSGAETFKMAYNASSTIAALKTITARLLQLPVMYLTIAKRRSLDSFLHRIPPLSFAQFEGHTTIAPAKTWERINNSESPQLYPVFPWSIYGVGKPDLAIALNTWRYDTTAIKFRSYIGWKQDNIFAARLGLTTEAAALTFAKLKNSGNRFPAFWGPGYDWAPDHNWGGSGMIGLQEMLLQTDDKKIYLFPAWPKNLDVHFKLHAPYRTTVEAVVKNGKVASVIVSPASRTKDVINLF